MDGSVACGCDKFFCCRFRGERGTTKSFSRPESRVDESVSTLVDCSMNMCCISGLAVPCNRWLRAWQPCRGLQLFTPTKKWDQ